MQFPTVIIKVILGLGNCVFPQVTFPTKHTNFSFSNFHKNSHDCPLPVLVKHKLNDAVLIVVNFL